MTMREKLLFLKPIFHDGMNMTVRDGLEWNNIVDYLPMLVDVTDAYNRKEIVGTAHVVGKLVVKAKQIPNYILFLHHDDRCLSHDGLGIVMRSIYGDDWDLDYIVTCLLFYFNQ